MNKSGFECSEETEAADTAKRKMVALRNLKVAMAAMGTAYKDLEEAMSSLYLGDVNNYVAEGYPFERSFDEMGDIVDWATCSIAKIDKELM